MRNRYAILRVPETADAAAIRRAFKALARRYHPDAGKGSSAQKFRDVAEAYSVLSDPRRRREHDSDLARSRAHFDLIPEPLIPEKTRHVPLRQPAYDFDQEILVQLFGSAFGVSFRLCWCRGEDRRRS